jgi:hypothetical protein
LRLVNLELFIEWEGAIEIGINGNSSPEATSLKYKHVVFRKPWCSATEKLRADCVQNVEKNVCSCRNFRWVGTTLFFTMFLTQSASDFSVAEHDGLRNTTCLNSKYVASVVTSWHIHHTLYKAMTSSITWDQAFAFYWPHNIIK